MALDDENPFAASDVGFASAATDRSDLLEPVPMDPGAILSRCLELTQKNLGVVIGAALLPIIPALGFSGIDFAARLALSDSDEALVAVASLAVSLCSSLVTLFFSLGQIRIFSRLARGQDAELGMLVGEGASYLNGLAAQIILVVVMAVGIGLLLIPGIIAGLGFQFVLYVVVDRGMGPIEAMKESWRLTDGYKTTIFGINLLIGLGFVIFSCVTLGIGYFLAIPVLVLTQAVMYHSLSHFQNQEGWGA